MSTIKIKTYFLLDKEKNKPNARLRYRVKWDNNIVAFNVGYRIDVEKWSLETQRCKNNTTHGKDKISASVINRDLSSFENACENVFNNFKSGNKTPTENEFRDAFNTEIGRLNNLINKPKGFFDIYEEFVSTSGFENQWTDATYKKFKSIKKHISNYKKDLDISNITESDLQGFVSYLNYAGLRNTTIIKTISFLKWFLRWSVKKGYNNSNVFETFNPRIKTTPKTVVFLTWKEVMQLRNFEIPKSKQYLERIRDVFLFTCFTGLRYSDVYNLKWSNITDDCIDITTIKTADRIKIDLNNYSRKILEKYKDSNFGNNKVLPVISNQKMNDYLKELGELAELNEPITEVYYVGNERIENTTLKYNSLGTHAGRRTFICISLALGVPAQTVMKWTGHSDYKAMKPYIDIADEDRKEAMKVWNKKESEDANKLLEQLKELPKDKLDELLKQLK